MTEGITGMIAQTVLAALPPTGEYFSLVKILLMMVLPIPWLYFSPWVNKDAVRVRASQAVWSIAVVVAGMLGLIIWLVVPFYIVGLLVYLVLSSSLLLAYVAYRNGRVPEEMKVLTGGHLQRVFQKSEAKRQLAVHTRVKLYDADGKIFVPPDASKDSPDDVEAYNLAQDLLHDILWRRASEADVIPAGAQARVRLVVDGLASDCAPLELVQSEAIIQYLKPVAGMAGEDRRRPQQGKIAVDLAGSPIDMLLTSAGTTGGQRMQFRIVQESVRTRIADLGISEDILGRLDKLAHGQNGLIIVSGRPGNGITSTLYSLLRTHDAFIKQLVTLEAKPQVTLDNITQYAYGEPRNLPDELASAIRRDPDVIMLDSCPDAKTAEMIRGVAAEKPILLGLHASDTFVALSKWIRTCGRAEPAMENLRAVLCQALLRKLCPNCREPYHPDPQMLAKANLMRVQVDKFYRPPTQPLTDEKGHPIVCPTCHGNGYFGRTAAFELLEITDELRQLILARAPLAHIKAACRKNKMLYLQEQALTKVIQGITSVQEVIRVTQPPQTAKG